ncbi:hypothetical protein HG530_001381 [Fusarium avenaceum]|nr:hypothetical protein HG530_001381 [Fusarium avenaceum]
MPLLCTWLLNNGSVVDHILGKLSWRYSLGVEAINIVHESRELLADEAECNSLGSCCLRGGFLSDGPSETTNSRSVKHRPCDHEHKEGGIRSSVGGACHGSACNDDGPTTEQCSASDEGLSAGKDVGDCDGNAVGEELKSRRYRGKAEGVGLADKLEVVCLVGVYKVLRLQSHDSNESSASVLLGKDGPPACLLCHIGLARSNLELRLDEVEPFLDIDGLSIELGNGLSGIVISSLLDIPDGRLGEKGEADGEQSGNQEGHDEGETITPLALNLGGTKTGDGREEETQHDDDVSVE